MPEVKRKPKVTDAQLDERFKADCEKMRRHKRSVGSLAKMLGVWRYSLELLHCGWNGYYWTFPERTPTGLVTGVSTRHKNGDKRMVTGSRRGLIYPDGLLDYRHATILVVEGASDVAAAITMGFMAVGRPNNTCGGEMVAKLLRGWNSPIVVMGENDRRVVKDGLPHKEPCLGCQRCHPGLYGMRMVAKCIRERLRRNIIEKMPPDGAKDVRSWLNVRWRPGDDPIKLWSVHEEFGKAIGVM